MSAKFCLPFGFVQQHGNSVQVGSGGKVVLPSETMSQSTNNRAPAWLQSPRNLQE